MTLRNSERTNLNKETFYVSRIFFFFFLRIHFRKYVTFAHRENKKVSRQSISGHLVKKNFHLLTNVWWLWSIHQTMLSLKGRNAFLFNAWKQPWKGVRKTERMPLPESILHNLKFPKNGFCQTCQKMPFDISWRTLTRRRSYSGLFWLTRRRFRSE